MNGRQIRGRSVSFHILHCLFNFLLFYILLILILHGFKSCHLHYVLFLLCIAVLLLLLLFLLLFTLSFFLLLLLLFYSFFLPFVVMFLYPPSSLHFILCFYSLFSKKLILRVLYHPVGKLGSTFSA